MKTDLLDRQQILVQWVSQATGINTFGVKVRLQGNDLHILCEGTECPQRWRTLYDLLLALQQTNLDVLTNSQQPSIYQVFVYGRKKGEHRPQWCHRVYLNQLERHLEQAQQALLTESEKSLPGGALIVSNESLARQGNPDAIARYLSETLSNLGVAVQVKIQPYESKTSSQSAENRLWIFCQSSYSPDASLLAEPIAHNLRYLKLIGYHDAVIVSQVRGESVPDWRLRVDLTPPAAMLKEWARWGDVQAIARLLTEVLSESKVIVQAALKESTLHIFCTPAADPLETAPVPNKTLCLQVITSQLEVIAPQGILAATVYGQKTGSNQPDWIDWLSLPAAEHPALQTSTLDLAIAGDEQAITFLLERLLNPDLDWRLKTGGIRVLLLSKGDLLHVMCDAPICPTRQQVANKVVQFIRQLNIPGIVGIRVYGRRAGNKEPFWHYGMDFQHRQRLVPEATPEFAATPEYVADLIISETNEPILRPDLTTQEVQTFVVEAARDSVANFGARVRKLLLDTQLFTETTQSPELNPYEQGIMASLVWVFLGLLLTLQTDWMLGYVVARTIQSSPTKAAASSSSLSTPLTPGKIQSQGGSFLADTTKTNFPQGQGSEFNAADFTQNGDNQSRSLPTTSLQERITPSAMLSRRRIQMPSFNSHQLDEQLALYKQRLAMHGSPPDVLIIGSSRALRGIDPVALSQALANQGYPHIDVFNLGINGATAQVVDFIIRRVIQPSELPKLIIWADGSRAFNSGREDVTFQAISVSSGYKQVWQKALTNDHNNDLLTNLATGTKKQNNQDNNSYQDIDRWLDQALAKVSASYQNRDYIKSLLQRHLKYLPFSDRYLQNTSQIKINTDNPEEDNSLQAIDFDGFLPLSIRFNPASYYQKHPKVSGSYDNDYKSFQLGGEQEAALKTVLWFAQANKISVVFVNMPLTNEYLDPVRKKYEQEFQQYMLNLSASSNFIYRDLSQSWLTANNYFSDPSHLNRYGAYEVARKLANDPMIPWPLK